MKRVVSGVVAISLCACSADPGYEPRYEPLESPRRVTSEPQPQPTTRSIEASRKDIAAMQLCADKFAHRLPKTSDQYAVMYDLAVTGDGITVKVKDSQISGMELEKCLTNVLERMEVPDSMTSASRVSPQSRSAMGVVQVIAPIALLPIVLVAGGVTILVGVTIVVAAEAIEALRRRRTWENECDAQRAECLMSNIADQPGGLFKHTLCHMCREYCVKSGGKWPSEIERFDGTIASCAYWRYTGN